MAALGRLQAAGFGLSRRKSFQQGSCDTWDCLTPFSVTQVFQKKLISLWRLNHWMVGQVAFFPISTQVSVLADFTLLEPKFLELTEPHCFTLSFPLLPFLHLSMFSCVLDAANSGAERMTKMVPRSRGSQSGGRGTCSQISCLLSAVGECHLYLEICQV